MLIAGVRFYQSVSNGDSSGVGVYDKDAKVRGKLGTFADGSTALTLFDAEGKVIWKAPKD